MRSIDTWSMIKVKWLSILENVNKDLIKGCGDDYTNNLQAIWDLIKNSKVLSGSKMIVYS